MRGALRIGSVVVAAALGGCGAHRHGIEYPEGDFVAFVADAESPGVFEAFVSDATGTSHRKVAGPSVAGGHVDEVAWSPDRSWLAVLGDLDTVGKRELYVVDPNAAPPVLQKVSGSGAQAGFGGVSLFRWAPNSARLAFTKEQDAEGVLDLFTVLVGGVASIVQVSAPVNFDPNGLQGGVVAFEWKPDGNTLAYSADLDVDNTFHLYVVAANGSGHQRCDAPVGDPVDDDVTGFAWAPDGSRLAFGYDEAGAGHGTSLFSCLPTGLGTVKLSPLALDRSISTWGWAPDSTRLLYGADQMVAGRKDLFVVDAAGPAAVTPLVAAVGTQDVEFPRWSPDSTRIAYHLYDQTNVTGTLEVVAASGGVPTLLVSPGGASGDYIDAYEWSPDGQDVLFAILYQSTPPTHDAFGAVRADGSNLRTFVVTGEMTYPTLEAWSPDSTRVAYGLYDLPSSTGTDVFVVDADGGSSRRLSDVPPSINQVAQASDLRWTADSQFVLFTASAPDAASPFPRRLWIAGRDQSSAVDVLDWAPPEATVKAYALK